MYLDQVFEFEKWVQAMSARKFKVLARACAKDGDWKHLQRCLAWFPLKVIKKIPEATTNYAYTRHRKFQNPVSPKNRVNESNSTDPFFADEKALGGWGGTCEQIFCGKSSY